jgi:hypothetical protein
MLEPFELEFYHKKVTAQKTDILLENMLDYYVSLEMYEYAVIIRDEINSRNKKTLNKRVFLMINISNCWLMHLYEHQIDIH